MTTPSISSTRFRGRHRAGAPPARPRRLPGGRRPPNCGSRPLSYGDEPAARQLPQARSKDDYDRQPLPRPHRRPRLPPGHTAKGVGKAQAALRRRREAALPRAPVTRDCPARRPRRTAEPASRDSGCNFRLAYFQPASGLNEELQRLHAANLFAVVRQLHFSDKTEESVDLGLFLNGIPIFTAELKNPLTGQTVEDAIRQYRNDRDPREPLFGYGRCLAHFAVDSGAGVRDHAPRETRRPDSCRSTRAATAARETRPVPLTRQGYPTDYLWERIWARDSILDLIRQFIQEVTEEDVSGRRTGKRFLIFPRYQQLDCVRRLVNHARNHGPGERYLIQHSAGSGKSYTIAWLAPPALGAA